MELSILDIKLLTLFISKEVLSSNTKYPFNEHLLFMIRDLCLNKMLNSYKLKIKDKNKKFIVIDFINNFIGTINISGILHFPNINNLFPIKDRYYNTPFISYKYTSKIRSKFTNYQTVVNVQILLTLITNMSLLVILILLQIKKLKHY